GCFRTGFSTKGPLHEGSHGRSSEEPAEKTLSSAGRTRREPVVQNLSRRTYRAEPVVQNLSCRTCRAEPVVENLSWRTCRGEPVVENLSWRTCPGDSEGHHPRRGVDGAFPFRPRR